MVDDGNLLTESELSCSGWSGDCHRLRGSLLHFGWWHRFDQTVAVACGCDQQFFAQAKSEEQGRAAEVWLVIQSYYQISSLKKDK